MKHKAYTKLLLCSGAALCLLLGGCGGESTVLTPLLDPFESHSAQLDFQHVLPESTAFEDVALSEYSLPSSVTQVLRETHGKGYVIKLKTTGWKPDMDLHCGITTDGTITGAVCVSSGETLGAEKEYGENFIGKNFSNVAAVDTIAGATLTTNAYRLAMVDATKTVSILEGRVGSGTPEGEFANSLKAALPEGDAFTKWFQTEELNGVDAIYVADNKAGYVCLIGEAFVGVDANGNSTNAIAAAAVKTLRDSILMDVNYHSVGIDAITAVSKTPSGNYVIDIDGRGFAWYDNLHGYGEQRFIPIKIRVSLTPSGTIIDCLTLTHEETTGIGDVCGTEDYYSQFIGKTSATYTQVDAIAGATYTTNGYLEALERCFEAVAILEGGGNE